MCARWLLVRSCVMLTSVPMSMFVVSAMFESVSVPVCLFVYLCCVCACPVRVCVHCSMCIGVQLVLVGVL